MSWADVACWRERADRCAQLAALSPEDGLEVFLPDTQLGNGSQSPQGDCSFDEAAIESSTRARAALLPMLLREIPRFIFLAKHVGTMSHGNNPLGDSVSVRSKVLADNQGKTRASSRTALHDFLGILVNRIARLTALGLS